MILYHNLAEKSSADDPKAPSSWFLSFNDKDNGLSISRCGFQCRINTETMIAPASEWQGVRSNLGIKIDPKDMSKYYYEIELLEPGPVRFGWATSGANLILGNDKNGYAFDSSGFKVHDNRNEPYGLKFGAKGDRCGALIDSYSGAIGWFKDNDFLWEAYRLPASVIKQPLFPCICVKGDAIISARFSPSGKCFKI